MVLELVLEPDGQVRRDPGVRRPGGSGQNSEAEQPDVVLLDLMLPGMDGFEICQRAKADEATRQIPIIFLTAQPQPASVARAMALGAAGYLVKPFDPIKIIDQINEALARVQAPLDQQSRKGLFCRG